MKRFWDKVEKTDTCWNWTAGTNACGYGWFRFKGTSTTAHRVAFELHHGRPITLGKNILHSCDNTLCVNPAHLREGTQKDNVADMFARGRAPKRPRLPGERNPNSKLTSRAVVYIKDCLALGFTQGSLAEEFGVSRTAIHHVAIGKTWAHVGGE